MRKKCGLMKFVAQECTVSNIVHPQELLIVFIYRVLHLQKKCLQCQGKVVQLSFDLRQTWNNYYSDAHRITWCITL